MRKWLKSQFVPHEINGFKPLLLRRKSAFRIAGALAILELALFVLPTLYFPQYAGHLNLGAVLPSVLSELTNSQRAKNNLQPLSVNDKLAQAAQLKAEDMASKGYFAHNSPDGRTPWYWFDYVGYKYDYAGENLAVNFSDSEEVTQAWMNSPTHQANIVGRNYTQVGTGIASGMYKGHPTVFVVQLYGAPKVLASGVTPAPARAVSPVTQSKPATVQVAQPAASATNLANAPQTETVLGESTPDKLSEREVVPLKTPNFLQRLMSSPKNTTNAVLYLALAVVLIALFLIFTVKFDKQFPELIANGAVIALLIIGVHLGNNFISSSMLETSFMEYSPANASSSLD